MEQQNVLHLRGKAVFLRLPLVCRMPGWPFLEPNIQIEVRSQCGTLLPVADFLLAILTSLVLVQTISPKKNDGR